MTPILLAVSDVVWQALIAAALAAFMGILEIWGQTRTDRQLRAQGEKLEVVHLATNSIVSRLVETTKDEAHAQGQRDERDRQAEQDRRDEPGDFHNTRESER